MRIRAIINPNSSNRRTGKLWPRIEAKLSDALGPIEAVYTEAPMQAARLTAEALKDGVERVISVGGDGTNNEVINGFFEKGAAINPEAALSFLASGTGGDLRKTLGIPTGLDAQIEALAKATVRRVDVGLLHFTDQDGAAASRYFGNITSFGLGGATSHKVNALRFAKRLGGKFAYKWGMAKALLTYRNQFVRIIVDDVFDEVVSVNVAAVCNGQYFGGGMKFAPNARPDDGLFDVVIVADVGNLKLLQKSGAVYKGDHLDFPVVTALQGRHVEAIPEPGAKDVLLDVDGESPGRLPAKFELLPEALKVQ